MEDGVAHQTILSVYGVGTGARGTSSRMTGNPEVIGPFVGLVKRAYWKWSGVYIAPCSSNCGQRNAASNNGLEGYRMIPLRQPDRDQVLAR
jgi:hypothetical protein